MEKYKGIDAPDLRTMVRAMERDEYSVFEWSDRPGTVYGMHEHSDDQSHCIVSGKMEFTVEGSGTFVLGPGDRDFMPAGTKHTARVVGDERVVYLIGSKNY